MAVRIEIREHGFEPLAELAAHQQALDVQLAGRYGATASFIGTMRDHNEGDDVRGMRLEHYPGMTERELARLAGEAVERWSLLDALVIHRVGELRPNDPIVLVAVWSAHRGAAFDASAFDRGEPYDSSAFSVSLQWLRLQPLVFDVVVPYFVDAAVRRLMADSGYGGRFTLFKGLTLDAIQRVVDRSRAAGVRGTVQYAVRLPSESAEARPWDDAGAQEQFSAALAHRTAEQLDADEALAIGTLDREAEQHDASERFVIGGNYNVAVFDGAFGFL